MLISEPAERLQKILQDLQLKNFPVGLKIGMDKSKVMLSKNAGSKLFSLGSEIIEQVDETRTTLDTLPMFTPSAGKKFGVKYEWSGVNLAIALK